MEHKQRWLWVWVVMWLLPGLSVAQQACTLTLQGQVVAADTGEPLPFASVVVDDGTHGTDTDADGLFTIPDLCAGTHRIQVVYLGYQTLDTEVRLSANASLRFALTPEGMTLDEVTVVSEAPELRQAAASATLSRDDLEQHQGEALGKLLEQVPGVMSLKTGATIVKPVIQGLHSTRVMLVENGVVHEGQQWGAEHAPEVDPFIAHEIEVVKGAGALRYGAGAIGGAIIVQPPHLRRTAGLGGTLNLAAATQGRSGTVSGSLEGRLPGAWPLAGRIQGTFKRAGNLHTPDYYLDNTGLAMRHWSWAAGLEKGRWDVEAFYSHFRHRLGILKDSHFGNVSDLEDAIVRGRPLEDGAFSYDIGRPMQKVVHELFLARVQRATGEKGRLEWQYSRQFNRRQEFDAHRAFGQVPTTTEVPEIQFEITTHQAEMSWHHQAIRGFWGSMGVQGTLQRNTTDRGGLIPNYDARALGLFWVEHWKRYPFPLEFEAGLRYDWRELYVANRGNELIDRTLHYHGASATAGLIWRMGPHSDARLHLGTAWRAPHVSELYSDGVHHGSASYERGRDDLVPERALSATLSWHWHGEVVHATLGVYRNYIRDYIFLEPLPEPQLTIRGAFPAFAYNQTDAVLAGADAQVHWHFAERWGLDLKGSWLMGRNLLLDDWLPWMPPARLGATVQFLPKGEKEDARVPSVEAGLQWTARQRLVPDMPDFAPPPAGYVLASASVFWPLRLHGMPLELGLTGENLLNARYREYLNRFRYFADEPGRNVTLRLKWT
ncbi:MAG: TonB-dependent receptor, partial [Bacteroidetes bacterium]